MMRPGTHFVHAPANRASGKTFVLNVGPQHPGRPWRAPGQDDDGRGIRNPSGTRHAATSTGCRKRWARTAVTANSFPTQAASTTSRRAYTDAFVGAVEQAAKIECLRARNTSASSPRNSTACRLNLSALALDCGLTHNTARAWLSVLETSGIAYLLEPYHRNFGKRLVKSPKLYFVDTGLAARLLGIRTAEELFVHPNKGNLFESFVVAELLKVRYSGGLDPNLYFWRDSVGTEVDIVFEEGQRIKAIEVKSGKTFSPELASGLEAWMRYSGAPVEGCSLVYAGERGLRRKGLGITPWNSVSEVLT